MDITEEEAPPEERAPNTKRLENDDAKHIAQNPAAVQATIVALQRDYIVEALRIAAMKAAHAADDVEIGDDAVAERGIELEITNLREASAAFRQLQRMEAS